MNEKEMMASRGFITAPVAAQRLGWSRGRVYRAIDADKVKFETAGSITYVEVASLLKFAGEEAAKRYKESVREERAR
jgi:hypothetical protein